MFGSKVVAEPDKLNRGTADEICIVGYQSDSTRLLIVSVLCVLSGGLLLLLLTWKPSIRLWFTHKPCDLNEASRILCTDIYGQEWEEEVVTSTDGAKRKKGRGRKGISCQAPPPSITSIYFVNKNIKYIWDNDICLFTRLRSQECTSSLHHTYHKRDGLSNVEANRLLDLHGENFIKIEVMSVWQIILQQIRNPFYVFQLYTIVLWCLQYYYVFAVCISVLSLLSIACGVWETRRQSRSLRAKMTTQSEVDVIRSNGRTTVSSRMLVPGDLVMIEAGAVLEVDLLLVDGSVVVTEAVLTGESVPITKVGVSNSEHLQQKLDYNLHRQHLLYSGCEILQVRGSSQVTGVVVNTGFSTFRGELVRSILFPKPIPFHLYSDFLKMLFCFLLLGLVAVGWSVYVWLNSDPPALWYEVVFNSLDLLTFVVPPILPATMTAINVWAQRRLKKTSIFCLSSNYVALAGPVDVACFDKTGTLTEDDLELAGAIACAADGSMCSPVDQLWELPVKHHLLQLALGCCHTLTAHNTQQKTFTRDLIGHPMDVKIFNSLKWELEERDDGCINQEYGLPTPVLLRPTDGTGEVAQLKVYPFDSKDQRMTVVVTERFSNRVLVLTKGAPELLAQKCDPESVPANFEQVLTWYTLQGLRVLALAGVEKRQSWHELSTERRDVLEQDSKLLGLVLFHNPIKPETAHALKLLQHADITTTMITGDNLTTAISVARECGLVKPLQRMLVVRAQICEPQQQRGRGLRVTYHQTLTSVTSLPSMEMLQQDTQYDKEKEATAVPLSDDEIVFVLDGHTWELIREHDRPLLATIAYKARVFARMKPDQKVQVIEELRDLGHQVAMCGDGCNDCGALKAAHVGISLAATEASVAAPFTSTEGSIDCVHTLIREGRATLVSTYASFKYNISYGFASLIIVIMHFSIQTEPSDTQYLIMDLVLITVPSLVLGNTGAPKMLVKERPTRRIIHPLHIISILSFLAIQGLAYWICWIFTHQQPWFEPFQFVPGLIPSNPSYENTALVIFSFYTFIIGAVVFSHALPFRKSIYTNYILTAYLLLATVCVAFFTFYSDESFNKIFNFRNLPHDGFRWLLLLGALVNFLVCFIWERWVLYGVIRNRLLPWIQGILPPHRPHQKLERKLYRDENWPPVYEYDGNQRYSTISSMGRTEAVQDIDSDQETETQVLMMRKLSRRGRFKASVKYINDEDRSKLQQQQRNGSNDARASKIVLTSATTSTVPATDQYSSDSSALLKDSSTPDEGNTLYTDVSDGGHEANSSAAVAYNRSSTSDHGGIAMSNGASTAGHDGGEANSGSATAELPSSNYKPIALHTFSSTNQQIYNSPSSAPEEAIYNEPIYSNTKNTTNAGNYSSSHGYSGSSSDRPTSQRHSREVPDYSPPDYLSVIADSASENRVETSDDPLASSSPRNYRKE